MSVRRSVLPDTFGRTLSWREWFVKGAEWLYRPLPKTTAELELEAEREFANRAKHTIWLNLDTSPDEALASMAVG